MLAKLFQEFHPMGAAQKHTFAEAASRNAKRTSATYHVSAGAADGAHHILFAAPPLSKQCQRLQNLRVALGLHLVALLHS